MRRILTALLIALLFAPELPARSNRDWEDVKKLKPGTSVEIWLWSGENLSGEIDDVSDTGLRVVMVNRSHTRLGPLREVDRETIRRIASFRKPHLPDTGRWMLRGVLVGGAIGLTAGVVSDARHGGNYHWFEGALGGAGLGFFASCAALGTVGIVELARGLHRRKVVYEDKGNHLPHGDRGSITPNVLHPITPNFALPKMLHNGTTLSGACGEPGSSDLCAHLASRVTGDLTLAVHNGLLGKGLDCRRICDGESLQLQQITLAFNGMRAKVSTSIS
jgi:hypothetical protein